MLRPYHHARIRVRFFCLFLSFYIQSAPTQSPPRYAAPTPPTSPLSHRLPLLQFFPPIPSSPNAATSPTGTNCCTPPYPPPAAPSTRFALSRHSERTASPASRMILRSEESLRSFLATRHSPLATSLQPLPTPHPAPPPQSPSPPPLSPPDKTSPPHTSHSYPSTPPPASPSPPPPQQSPPATPPPAKTNNDYDNANVRTRKPRSRKEKRDAGRRPASSFFS